MAKSTKTIKATFSLSNSKVVSNKQGTDGWVERSSGLGAETARPLAPKADAAVDAYQDLTQMRNYEQAIYKLPI